MSACERSRVKQDVHLTTNRGPVADAAFDRLPIPSPETDSSRLNGTPIRIVAVELTHSGWEKLGDAAAIQRERYERGWGRVFERYFVDYANSAAT